MSIFIAPNPSPSAGGIIQWEDINGRPDLSNVSSMKVAQIVLQSGLWFDSQQTVTVHGILADENQQLIIPVPKSTDKSAYFDADIECIGQDADSLTFKADTIPETDLYVNVFVFGAAEVGEEFVGEFEWWSPKMTSNNTPAPYVASATTDSGDQSAPYHAFDGISVAKQSNSGTFSGGLWSSKSGGGYVQIDFGRTYTIRGFKINIPYHNSGIILAPNRMEILGSNDGNNWEVIGDYKNIEWHSVGEYSEFMLDKSVKYRYYRFGAEDLTRADMPSASYTNFCIGDVEFFKLEDAQ